MIINSFLKKIAVEIDTKNKNYSAEDFYYVLKYLGIKKNTELALDIEKFYNDFLESLSNSLVKYDARSLKTGVNVTHYLGFYVDKKANFYEAIKVYFPVKYEYMISALKTIFLYLIRNNIKSQVKFYVKATNDNIVIQFYDKKEVSNFINYCKNNFVLNDLLVKVNPFIATISGIGLVNDSNMNGSYNRTLSYLLRDYFAIYQAQNILNKVSDITFLDYVIMRKNSASKEDLYNISAIEENMKIILNNKNPLEENDCV